jgi:hypothetical protein
MYRMRCDVKVMLKSAVKEKTSHSTLQCFIIFHPWDFMCSSKLSELPWSIVHPFFCPIQMQSFLRLSMKASEHIILKHMLCWMSHYSAPKFLCYGYLTKKCLVCKAPWEEFPEHRWVSASDVTTCVPRAHDYRSVTVTDQSSRCIL